MDRVADLFVDEFSVWARATGTPNARLHLAAYMGTTVVCVYEPWPDGVPGLLVGDLINDDWRDEELVAGMFVDWLVNMLEPGGSRGFDYPREADHSIIHWGEAGPFGHDLPRTPEQLRAGVAPPGFVSRLPEPQPGLRLGDD